MLEIDTRRGSHRCFGSFCGFGRERLFHLKVLFVEFIERLCFLENTKVKVTSPVLQGSQLGLVLLFHRSQFQSHLLMLIIQVLIVTYKKVSRLLAYLSDLVFSLLIELGLSLKFLLQLSELLLERLGLLRLLNGSGRRWSFLACSGG